MRGILIGILALVFAAFVAPAASGAESTLETVKKRGTLVAGVRFDGPPMGFINKEGQNDGFEVDLVKEIAKKLGVKARFVQAVTATRIPLLVNGNVDLVVATMTRNRRREEVIDFSIHYYISAQGFITRKDTGIAKISQLAGKQVSSTQGGTSAANLLRIVPTAKMVYFQELTESALALKQGKVDATVSDWPNLLFWLKNNPELVIPDRPYYTEPWGMGVRENDSDWRDFIDAVILELWETKRYHALFRKWFIRDPEFELPWYP